MSSTSDQASADRSIRVALLVEAMDVPAWVAETIRQVKSLAGATICVVIINPVPDRKTGALRRLWRSRRHLLYRLYSVADQKLFGAQPDAFASCDLKTLLADVAVEKVQAKQSRLVDRFSAASVQHVQNHDIDVCLNFCHRIQRGAILSIAARGVWSFHHGDAAVYRGGPPGFWEVMEQNPVTGSTLQVLSEELDGGQVLDRSWSATDPTSVSRTCNAMFWKTTRLMSRGIQRLTQQSNQTEVVTNEKPVDLYSRRLYRPPPNGQAIKHLGAHAARSARRKLANLWSHEQWQLLYHVGPGLPASVRQMKRLVPPADRLWADPFVMQQDERCFVFVEELIYRRGRAHISVLEFDRTSQEFSAPQIVLERDYHLSYPNVFQYDGRYWMIPETSERRQVELYVADSFPHSWRLHSVLMHDVEAVDATLLRHDDRWWMFVGIAEVAGASTWDELFLFCTEDFRDPDWQAHPSNPIVSDVRRARPAGPIMVHDGQLIRPSQDCSHQYGYGLRLNRITTLNRLEYAEQEIAYVTPQWEPGVFGIHHLSRSADLTVMDVSARRSRLASKFVRDPTLS